MARFSAKGFKELSKKLSKLDHDTTEIAKQAVYEGASILADEIKTRLEGNLIGSKTSTGDLVDSFGVAPIQVKENGDVDTVIGFHGYDRKGVPNQLKARAMESGTSKQPKRPFVRPAVQASRARVVERMTRIVEMGIEESLKKGK